MLFWHGSMLLVMFILIFFSSHPITMCLILVLISSVVGAFLSVLINQWLMVAVLLIFLGGMMVIFMYCSFMTNEEKLKIDLKKTAIILILTLFYSSFMVISPISTLELMEISQMFQYFNIQMVFFLLLYLLMSLLSAIYFTKSFMGAMSKHDN